MFPLPRRLRFATSATRCAFLPAVALLLLLAHFQDVRAEAGRADRNVLSLDGSWSVEDGVLAEEIPATFSHTVMVPGLTNQARPILADVDQYETHEYVFTMKRYGVLPASETCDGLGRTRQSRHYFWYERAFSAPGRRDHATLVVNKAQFGTAVWLNGKKVGEHLGCFTAGQFDVTAAMNWNGDNRLVIRIGAHPGVMPDWAFWGSDGEKGPWTPGIYDRVQLLLADSPAIESVQIAPRIAAGEVLVQTRLRNNGVAPEGRAGAASQDVEGGSGRSGNRCAQPVDLAAGEENHAHPVSPGASSGPVGARQPVSLPARDRAPEATSEQRGSACASFTSTRPRDRRSSTARCATCAGPASRYTGSSAIRSAAGFHGTKPGCGSCWSRFPTACTGTPSGSASALRRSSGSTLPTRPGCYCNTSSPSGAIVSRFATIFGNKTRSCAAWRLHAR